MLTPIDLLIEARWIIPVEPAGLILENHAIAINEGRIVAILQQFDAKNIFSPKKREILDTHVLIPGLINLHTHAAMTLFRGLADDLPLETWLKEHIWPLEGRYLSPDFVWDGTLLACAEMLLGGITCFKDMYFFPASSADAAKKLGMRASIGLVVLDFPSAYGSDAEDYLSRGLAIRDTLRDEPLLHFSLDPHAPYTLSDRSLEKVLTLAEQCNLPLHMHAHETAKEIADALSETSVRPIERLKNIGFLGPQVTLAHAVHMNAQDIDTLAEHSVSVAHCPNSNLKLASGIAPVTAMTQAGINIGLGTDSAASNNRLDIFEEMRLSALLAKAESGDARAIDAHTALHMATLAGARALGLSHEIGSLAIGKSADIVALNLAALHLVPCHNPISALVYAGGRQDVTEVWIAGKHRVSNGKLIDIHEMELIKLAALWQNPTRPK